VFLEVPEDVLEQRLIDRWLALGFAPEEARNKALANDIPNARRMLAERGPADVTLG
jgi:pantothenate kinase